MIKNKNLYERFLRYVTIDTQSDEDAVAQPSTEKQKVLAGILAQELESLGAEVDYDEEFGYVYAYVAGEEPAIGFVAHMDTSPAASGTNVKPRLIENYQGEDTFLHSEEFPELLSHIGEDLIATDGTTLLGADDKAGIAEIMNLIEYFSENPEISHRAIAVAFTPDEEVGRGTEHFAPARFRATEAYTVDGGKLGELQYECFNAAGARVEIVGKSVHTGDAKQKMVNACMVAAEFASMLPPAETPEHTEGYEGFFHLDSMEGTVEAAVLKYIIRDHDAAKFEARKSEMKRIADYMNQKYPGAVQLILKDQYRNMAEIMKDHMELIDRAVDAMKGLDIKPKVLPIRGGTDGAALCYMGIPCPNLCTGGYNYHGPYEFASVQEMELSAELLIRLAAAE